MERKKITFDSFIRGTICCVLIIGLLMLVERLSGVLLPFFLAWLIAYMIYPLVKLFQYKLRFKSRVLSIFCALISSNMKKTYNKMMKDAKILNRKFIDSDNNIHSLGTVFFIVLIIFSSLKMRFSVFMSMFS